MQSPTRTPPASTRVRTSSRLTRSTSTSPTASSSSWSDHPARARAPRCACSPASRTSTRAAIEIGGKDMTGVPSKDRDIAMVFQNYALYPNKTVAENMGFALKLRGVSADGAAQEGRGGRQGPRPDRVPGPQARQAVRRSASARRDGPRHRARAAGVLHGRAAVESGRETARADPHPDRRAATPARHHHRLRHPRPGRGHDDGRPGGRAALREAAAVRLAQRALRPPGQRVRRRLHRIARDEPGDAAGHRRRRQDR